jgi:hypothetical protein
MTPTHRLSYHAKLIAAGMLACCLLCARARAQVVTVSVTTTADPYAIAVNR